MGNSSIINNLSIRELKNFSIELPSLTNQNKIESVIRKLDVQLSQRKEQLQLLDELSESLFIDMFGDPVKNTKISKTIIEICNIENWFRGNSERWK